MPGASSGIRGDALPTCLVRGLTPTTSQTLLIGRSECTTLLQPATIVSALRDAFVSYSTPGGERARRVRAKVGGKGTSTVLFPGMTPGIPAYTVKVHAKFPGQDPAIRGVLCLHDLESGSLLAVMDSTHLTAVRTGLAGALAADTLAVAGAGSVTVIGAGAQGVQQLRSLALLRTLHRVRVYDTDPRRAQAYADALGGELGLPIEASPSLSRAVAEAEIVLTATWAREPFLLPGMLEPGSHVTTLGADEPGKAEVSAEVLRSALFVCDDRDLAVEMGALGGVGLGPDAVAAELGEVLAGRHPGRRDAHEITVFGGVGLAFQDTVAAWAIYQGALRTGAGREIDFLA